MENEEIFEEFDNDSHKLILEQYKLYVHMADKISDRRMATNTFYVSVNTLLIAIHAFLQQSFNSIALMMFAVVGIILSAS